MQSTFFYNLTKVQRTLKAIIMADQHSGLWKTIQESPPWAKGVLVVGVVGAGVAVYFLGLSLYRRARNAATQAAADATSQQTINTAGTTITQLASQNITPTYPDSQYQAWADACQQCYAGWFACTGDTVFINMKNDADIYKLIQAYGIRTISSGTWNIFEPDFKGDLPSTMRDVLDTDSIASINATLTKNGLTFQF